MEATKLDINHKFESLEKKVDQLLESQKKPTKWDNLPLMLSVKDVKQVLDININAVYSLFHQESFPSINFNNRLIIQKEAFREWLNEQREN